MSNTPLSGIAEATDRIGIPVAARIDALLQGEIERWASLDESLVEPLEGLRLLVAAGGKRLRPAFCYWAYVGAGGDPLDPAITDTGAALELLHSFALVHDDVMDDSMERRGRRSVHVEFARRHQDNNWSGEARRFGESVAILVGDMAFVYADKLMGRAPNEAMDVFTEMRIELNVGQYMDLSATTRRVVSEDTATRIATFKSGKYTVERPMHLGAALCGRFDELASGFSEFGIPVGKAFQWRDDVLGAFGDSGRTGKPTGIDLREGKATALVSIARLRAKGATAKLFDERYGAADLQESEVTQLQDALIETGARDEIDRQIDLLIEEGLYALRKCPIDNEARRQLEALAYFVAGREH